MIGALIVEFMVLKSKMYIFVKNDGLSDWKSKEINISVFKKINHEECKATLHSKKCVRHEMK